MIVSVSVTRRGGWELTKGVPFAKGKSRGLPSTTRIVPLIGCGSQLRQKFTLPGTLSHLLSFSRALDWRRHFFLVIEIVDFRWYLADFSPSIPFVTEREDLDKILSKLQ
jgi:hypothetical protein